ncbi:hypothetical protein NUU61_007466 [Penicillium alfredii]|uniref:Uncharacterized protein n=1 Tax=Penicillium alfredii TaxID=1506179 RepID=A0A9W9K4S3_9EURO|nr:uncharacterized protein NUU61_007466 [Penicillium alfredii]KAJ5092596.1 hypothetical protein NUU61_007466 [Penicillium alfredii]
MSTIRHLMENLSIIGHLREKNKGKVQENIQKLFNSLMLNDKVSMDAKDLQSLDLRSFNPEEENLQLPSQFFKPWSLSKLQQHEKNLEDKKASDMLHSFETVMREGDPFLMEHGGYETWRRTRSLCTRLAWEVQMFPRKGTTGNCLALKSLTHWRCSE